MSVFPAVFNLTNLNGNNGFAINGANGTDKFVFSLIAVGDVNAINDGDRIGYSVSGAGDVNGDGIADIIIGSYEANKWTGKSYIIYGQQGGLSNINLASLAPAQGFVVTGELANSFSSYSVSGAGDVNGDGISDIIIGALGSSIFPGRSYIIYGQQGGFSNINLASLAPAQGFVAIGAYDESAGSSVSGAGDVNGDGIADIIIGAPMASDTNGKSYVIYGKSGGYGNINLSGLTTTQGFVVTGAYDESAGSSVSGAGDVNGDGIADIIIGGAAANYFTGKSYIIYGRQGGLGNIDLNSLTTTQGFVVTGESVGDQSGYSVSGAGDVNGDGIADIIIGAPLANRSAGKSYVIYGKIGGCSNIDLPGLTTTQGFVITGAAGDASGGSVSGAGDVNGDGIADIIIGAWGANNGDGKSYVIYGQRGGFSNIDLASLDQAQGFVVVEASAGGYSSLPVSEAGDVNGDGIADIIIGAPLANNGAGRSYVIFGSKSGFTTPFNHADLSGANAADADEGVLGL